MLVNGPQIMGGGGGGGGGPLEPGVVYYVPYWLRYTLLSVCGWAGTTNVHAVTPNKNGGCYERQSQTIPVFASLLATKLLL